MTGLANENKYLGTTWSLNRADWFTDRTYFDANGNALYDTDWQDEATRNAVSHTTRSTSSRQARTLRWVLS